MCRGLCGCADAAPRRPARSTTITAGARRGKLEARAFVPQSRSMDRNVKNYELQSNLLAPYALLFSAPGPNQWLRCYNYPQRGRLSHGGPR
ncbi:hypothetical protein IF1G_07713 [Cordyceps javanica]|uniref:Uncharacterized protein n=1 Tax=Cordyceps javanica TaxID=43265 RepID=A0A545UX03_9HYPO|nr:hypothetical protein IF1G_07713 [Cordyceps javanica]